MNSTDKRLTEEFERVCPRVRPLAIVLFLVACFAAGFALMGVLR